MRTLITGGSGFIGTYLSEALLAQGDEVTILDLVPPTLEHPRLRFCQGSVVDDPASIWSLVRQADRVVHLASHVGIWHYLDQPEETVSIILDGTRPLLKACADLDRPLMFLSTSEAYGKGVTFPMREDGDIRFGSTDKTRWVYGLSKALAENLARAAARLHGLDVRIVRPFNVVGPGQSMASALVFPSFVRAVVEGRPLPVHGDGSQTRTYCHVRDLTQGIVRLMETPGASGHAVNLGNTREVTVLELARMFVSAAEVAGVGASIEMVPYEDVYPAGFEDTMRRVPDVSLAERLIGWSVPDLVPVEQIVSETVVHELAAARVTA